MSLVRCWHSLCFNYLGAPHVCRRSDKRQTVLFLSLFVIVFCFTTVLLYDHEIRRQFRRDERGLLFFAAGPEYTHTSNKIVAGGLIPKAETFHYANYARTIFVVSLQGTPGSDERNQGRFDKFRDAIMNNCKDKSPNIIHCPGVLDDRRGYGLAIAHIICFRKAMEINQVTSYFFEDDARPFSDKVNQFCDLISGSGIDSDYIPDDSLLTFLGGHTWQKKDGNTTSTVVESHFSYGTYAFVVPRHKLKLLLDSAENALVNGFQDDNNNYLHSDFLSPEKNWYRLARQSGLKIYAAEPLLIWHEQGYSNTWRKERNSELGIEFSFEPHKESKTTGAFANCSSNGFTSGKLYARREQFNSSKERVVVSCRSFNYRAPTKSFQQIDSTSIIVGVLSSAKNKDRRQTIRATWAKDTPATFFVVAGDWYDISEEYHTLHDLIWIETKEDFHDITYKSAAFFAVVDHVTNKLGGIDYAYVMKTDDDSYVALDRISSHINSQKVQPDYVGKCLGPRKPFRNKTSRYYTSHQEYPEEFFPDYCQGLGFLLSSRLSRCVVKEIESSRFLKHEDVFIGAMAKRCNVKHTLSVPEFMFRPYRSGCTSDRLQSVREEMKNLNYGKSGSSNFPAAEMGGRMVQHRIYSNEDMINHHESATSSRLIFNMSKLKVGETIEYYYSDSQGWSRSTILALNVESGQVKVKRDSGGSGEEVPLLLHLGALRYIV